MAMGDGISVVANEGDGEGGEGGGEDDGAHPVHVSIHVSAQSAGHISGLTKVAVVWSSRELNVRFRSLGTYFFLLRKSETFFLLF